MRPGAGRRRRFEQPALRSSTLPDGCPFVLIGPTGTELEGGRAIDGQGDVSAIALPDAGVYTVVINPFADGTGTITEQLHSS